ncbi:cysteine synthase B [Desulfonatronospira thiodismutans ASO3-1]|uniref:cysteine synthase n=1 Tax=Desulfonatronospira thiodismutans ASO3-1 TaxID=555779 RepID=D6SLW4_9BACT|nr:cysteine synthase [Desulfonatronospira thiodismutans]EFI35675.1 cysteine synthase B [Desulfonatronospira thiodismutans ASO3-1]
MSDLLSLIGNTPLVEIKALSPNPGVTILAKLEMSNPGGSVKDRVALAMIERAEKFEGLGPGKTVIEATSGNTGIGLAMVCALKKYPIKLIMPASASEERKMIMRAYGAEIVLTPGHLSTDGAIEEAYRLARDFPEKYVLMDQFNNPASIEAHYHTTGPEIWEQTGGSVTHVAACLGTTGTIMGITRRMRELNPEVRCIGIEPYAGHKIQGLKNMQESYPPGIYSKKALDRIIHVRDDDAWAMCRELARKEGIFVGMSSGAAMAGVQQLAREMQEGVLVTILPDGGERYLSTPLYSIPELDGIKIYDLQKRKKAVLQCSGKKPGIFTPGPRTNFFQDPDFWRRAVFLDVLCRRLAQKGHDPNPVAAVADFDDRTLECMREKGVSREDFSRETLDSIRDLAGRIKLNRNFNFLPAAGSLDTGIEMCNKLLSRGLAYEKLRCVYFDVGRDRDYGLLAGIDPEKIISGKTVDLEDYVKDSPRDFTLLKRASLKDLKEENVLKTKWGNVRPSWYLQMAAVAAENAGHLDLVMAGEAHLFPHLDNLLSIWKGSTSLRPQCWSLALPVHHQEKGEPLPGIQEMAREMGGFHPLRMWLMSVSYHRPLMFSPKNLEMWVKNWKRLQELMGKLKICARGTRPDKETGSEVEKQCRELGPALSGCLDDDLALYKFWPQLFEFCRKMQKLLDENLMDVRDAGSCLHHLQGLDSILKIIDWQALPLAENEYPVQISELLQARARAKEAKDFVAADELRDRALSSGFRLVDTRDGTRVYPAGSKENTEEK